MEKKLVVEVQKQLFFITTALRAMTRTGENIESLELEGLIPLLDHTWTDLSDAMKFPL